MEQRVSLVTLGVSDYARSKAFYEALGWSAALDIEETAFFQANGSVLVLWARDKLAEDTGISDDGARWGGIVLAHNVRSREEVEEVIEQARTNGAEITREPSETFYGGYAGAFLDLDGHPWEVAHNPGFDLDDDGNIVLPDTQTDFRLDPTTPRCSNSRFLALMHSQAETYLPRSLLEGGPPYRGLEGAAQLWADAFEVWEKFEIESREVRAFGDVLIFAVRVHCIPRGEGPPVDYDGYWVTELRDVKIAYWRPYLDRAEALEAAQARAAGGLRAD